MDPADQTKDSPGYNFQPKQLYDSLPIPPDSRFIRLLDLEGDKRDAESPLRGTLRLADLAQSPSYAALSYVWGPWSTPRDTISCNGCELEITQNCHEALLCLRNTFGAITIWVDAICINQNEFHDPTSSRPLERLEEQSEKVLQMSLMGEIYMYAQPAYCWLGAGSDSSDRAMAAIKSIARHCVTPGWDPWFPPRGKRSLRDEKYDMLVKVLRVFIRRIFGSSKPIPSPLNEQLRVEDLISLLETEWLQRAWTFQEFVLAYEPVLVCGRKYCAWPEFLQGIDALYTGIPAFTGRFKGCSFRNKLPCGPLPLGTFAPWRDLMRFYEHIMNTRRENTYFADRGLRSCILLSGILLLILPAILLLCAVIVAIVETSALQGYWRLFMLIEILPLGGFAGALAIAYNNSHIHIRSSYDPVSVIPHRLSCAGTEAVATLHCGPSKLSVARVLGEYKTSRTLVAGLGRVLQHRLTTEARDKSFALQGILKWLNDENLFTDPTTSLGEIYLQLFKPILSMNPRALNLLLDAGGGSFSRDGSEFGTPSWVPDWSTLRERAWLPESYVYGAIRDGLNDHRPRFELHANNKLEVNGILRGTVIHCTSAITFIPDDDDDEVFGELVKTMRTLYDLLLAIKTFRGGVFLDEYPEISDSDSVCGAMFAHLVPMGSSFQFDPDFPDSLSMMFYLWWEQTCLTFFAEGADLSEDSIQAKIEEFLGNHEEQRFFLRKLCNEFDGKRGLFFTSSGLVGTGPPDIAEGDMVASIVGVAAPLVLRPTTHGDDLFQVVGPAYIDMIVAWSLDESYWEQDVSQSRRLFPGDEQRVYENFGYHADTSYPEITLV